MSAVPETQKLPAVPQESSAPSQGSLMQNELRQNIDAMFTYAVARGLEIPTALIRSYNRVCTEGTASSGADKRLSEQHRIAILAETHQTLVRIVKPVTPETIRAQGRGEVFIKQMMRIGIGALVGCVFLTHDVISFWSTSANTGVLGEVRIILASIVGAAFYNIALLRKLLRTHTFEPARCLEHWTRLTLGVIAGVVLVRAFGDVLPGERNELSSLMLAILGGFSSDAVKEVMERMVESIKTFVHGGMEVRFRAEMKALRISMRAQNERDRIKTVSRVEKERLSSVVELLRLEPQLDDDSRVILKDILDRFLSPSQPQDGVR